ncbi:caspase family protein [Nocardia sp. NPDC047648]|uniref:caspase family protein n=1 Tax=Nocardia sp. NPDC047648 TaxID=3155625 RepID=UPI0033F9D7DB
MTGPLAGYRRAAVCIGVDRVAGLQPLRAAAAGATAVADWARSQGCDVTLLTDGAGSSVSRRDVFESVRAVVEQRIYDQLIVYFAGHGLLMSPGAEVWLLSDAASDSTEAVNMLLTAEHARLAGIPHVVLISDACRTYVSGPPFYGLTGASVFPLPAHEVGVAELDIYFGTAPGNPAYEVRSASRPGYGIFTHCLLDVLGAPPRDIVEYVSASAHPAFGAASANHGSSAAGVAVVTSRALKPPLITAVIDHAARIDPLLDQRPDIRVETALPQFLATVEKTGSLPSRPAPSTSKQATSRALDVITRLSGRRGRAPWRSREHETDARIRRLAGRLRDPAADLSAPIDPSHAWVAIRGTQLRHVTAVGWEISDQQQRTDLHRWEFVPAGRYGFATSAVLQFDNETGTVVPLVPGTVATVVVDGGRVTAMNYTTVTSGRENLGLRRMLEDSRERLAVVTDAAQNGDMAPALQRPAPERDPRRSLGRSHNHTTDFLVHDMLEAYAASEQGKFDADLIRLALGDRIVSFDLALLASRPSATGGRSLSSPSIIFSEHIVHPFTPLMTRGWLLLGDNPAPARPYHRQLARHLIPALYTTFDTEGVDIALDILLGGADS